MPQKSQLGHRVVSETNLPYISNNSPTSTEVIFDVGSQDILTSITGYCQRRPGFADGLEQAATVFINLQRLFSIERNDGNIYLIACDINASNKAVVYSYLAGTNASFVAIYTEAVATGVPYDFVFSNNTLYFANGVYAKKWDPANGVTNWGISIGSFSGSTSAYATTATTSSTGGDPWSFTSSATGAPDGNYAIAGFGNITDYLILTGYGFAVAAGNTINGIEANITAHGVDIGNGTDGNLYAYLVVNGVIGSDARQFALTGTDVTLTLGGSTDTWGWALSPTLVNSTTTFGIALIGTSPINYNVDSAQLTVYSSGAPSVTPTAGTLTATVGYQYVVTYGNSKSGHISSPTPPSNLIKPVAQGVQIGLTASTDPQVNQIHVYRTTDSATGLGGQTYFELPTSPYSNITASVVDNAADTALNVYSIAPTPTFNDPPPDWQGMVYFAGRIWGFVGNVVWFTGLEEIINGVPEESIPSGKAGNFWAFDQPVKALGTSGIAENQKLIIQCPGRVYAITGNTLDTFRRLRISDRRGCRSRKNISMMGGMCAWIDTANQIWATNGSDLQELGQDIRPDLTGLDHDASCLSFHVSGNYHWLVVSTGQGLLVFDIDTQHWMPPWDFSCQYLFSGETSPGNCDLMAAKPTKALKLNPIKFNDDGTPYQPVMVTNLFSLVSEDSPTRSGVPWYIDLETNKELTLSDVAYVVDDDSTAATFTSIFVNKTKPEEAFNRVNGTTLLQQVFAMNGPLCRWLSAKFTMRRADVLDKLYSFFISYEEKQ